MNRNEFFKTVYKDCEGLVEIRPLPPVESVFTRDPKKIDAHCKKYNDRGLYFGVATRDGKGGTKDNCLYVPGFWVDVDFKDTPKEEIAKILKTASIKPSIIVSSGNGLHLYFLFKKPLEASEDLEKYLRALCRHFKGDMGSTDISRVLRVPETVNHKYKEKPEVKVVSVKDKRYTLKDFEPFLENGGGEKDKMPFEEIFKGLPKTKRDVEMTRQIGRWITQGLRDEEIIELATAVVDRCEQPRGDEFTEKDVRRILKSLRKKEERNGVDRFKEGELVESTEFDPYSESITIGEIKQLEIELDWLLEKVIPLGGITVLVAFTGYGKTTLAGQIATAVARKQKIFGLKTKEVPEIWYLDYENALTVLKAYSIRLDLDDQIQRLPKPGGKPVPKIDGPRWDFLKKIKPGSLVIVDSLQACQNGSVNDQAHMNTVMGRLKEVRNLNSLTIVILHHTPAGNKNKAKGDTGVLDQADQYLLINKKPKLPGLVGEAEDLIANPGDPDDNPNDWHYRFGTKGEGSRCEPFHVYLNFDPNAGFVKIDECELEEIKATLREAQKSQRRRSYSKGNKNEEEGGNSPM